MIFTLGNKLYIDSVFRKSLKETNINHLRYSTQPSIFNNILWYAIAETESSYHVAYYSLLDTKNRFSDWNELPKKRALSPIKYDDIKHLAWFSNQYYSVYKNDDNTYQYNDLRYPLSDPKNPNSSVFSLLLMKENNRLNMKPFEPETDDFKSAISSLWERLKGN